MNISERIKQAREALGMTQEALAEKLDVSRQAVSKWELGASVPTPENLNILEDVLGVSLPAPEEETAPSTVPHAAPKPPSWREIAAVTLGVLTLAALLSIMMFLGMKKNVDVPVPLAEEIQFTGYYFYDETGSPLLPEYSAGMMRFLPGSRLLMVVTFPNDTEAPVQSVTAALSPRELNLFEVRDAGARQTVSEGQTFALFVLDIPQDLEKEHFLHLLLAYGSSHTAAQTIRISAPDGGPSSCP